MKIANRVQILPVQLKDIPRDVLRVMMQNLEGQDDGQKL